MEYPCLDLAPPEQQKELGPVGDEGFVERGALGPIKEWH